MISPVSVPEVLHAHLRGSRRPPDGLLHASSDLVGSLRHSMLRAAGAPERQSTLADDVVLMTGTMWHELAHAALVRAGLPFMQEIKLTPWLPEGWAGTADWVFFIPEARAFKLKDFKTIKGDGMAWVEKDGAKTEHLWQMSSYWHALYDMGLPLVEEFDVIYWPKDRGTRTDGPVNASVQSCTPIDRDVVQTEMAARWELTKLYLEQFTAAKGRMEYENGRHTAYTYLQPALAAVQERIQKTVWTKATKTWELKLVPHWSAAYCPFEPPLCTCSEQGSTKLGVYSLDGTYTPRKGYELVEPVAVPDAKEVNRKRKEFGE